jgi:hypothetical protein
MGPPVQIQCLVLLLQLAVGLAASTTRTEVLAALAVVEVNLLVAVVLAQRVRVITAAVRQTLSQMVAEAAPVLSVGTHWPQN